jgi:hypothetical protein
MTLFAAPAQAARTSVVDATVVEVEAIWDGKVLVRLAGSTAGLGCTDSSSSAVILVTDGVDKFEGRPQLVQVALAALLSGHKVDVVLTNDHGCTAVSGGVATYPELIMVNIKS